MKCILMTEPGSPDVLRLADVEKPSISADNEVLVRLRAAGINPVDTKLRSRGTYYPERMPAILGCDGAGVIEAVGTAVNDFKPGDEVYYCYGGIGGHPGNYAEYNVVDAAVLARKPATLDFATAAAAPLVLITAWESLHDRAGMKRGDTVLIHGGAGGVGHVAIQLAKAAGCSVITTVSSREKEAFVRRLGADHVMDYRRDDLADAILALTAGRGVDITLDTVGGKVLDLCFKVARPYGEVVSLLQPAADSDFKQMRQLNQRLSLELMLSPHYYGWPEALAHQGEILRKCAELFAAGKLQLQLQAVLPLAEAAQAHRHIEQGGMTGKLALRIE